jgi:hypothetical protein
VRCELSSFGILGPYFLEDDNGHAVSVTVRRYVATLNKRLLPQLRQATTIYAQYGVNKEAWHLTWHASLCKQFEECSQESKDSIRAIIPQVSEDMLRKTTDSLWWCAKERLQNNGAQLTDVVFKKQSSHGTFFYRLHKSVFLILTENKLPISQIYIIQCTLLPVCAKKLALTSPTSGGRSFGIVCSRRDMFANQWKLLPSVQCNHQNMRLAQSPFCWVLATTLMPTPWLILLLMNNNYMLITKILFRDQIILHSMLSVMRALLQFWFFSIGSAASWATATAWTNKPTVMLHYAAGYAVTQLKA